MYGNGMSVVLGGGQLFVQLLVRLTNRNLAMILGDFLF